MTDAGWAETIAGKKLGGQYISLSPKLTAALLKAEYARAVRIVKRQMGVYQGQREVEKNQSKRDMLAGSILACVGILTALQRGRGGKG